MPAELSGTVGLYAGIAVLVLVDVGTIPVVAVFAIGLGGSVVVVVAGGGVVVVLVVFVVAVGVAICFGGTVVVV